MPEMTDPSVALKSFQTDLSAGRLPLQRGQLASDLYVLRDNPNGRPRFIYLTIENEFITALMMLALVDPIESEPCFQLGIAIPQVYRGQGRAKKIVRGALAELQHGLAKNKITIFHIEAVVGIENVASQKVMADCISATPATITDSVSALPALHYIKKFNLIS